VWSYIVVVYLVARNDRRVGLLESPHHLFAVADFPVEAFHLVVVSVTLDRDVAYVFGSAIVGSLVARLGSSSSADVALVAGSHCFNVVHIEASGCGSHVSDAVEADWFPAEPALRPCSLFIFGG